MRAGLSLVLVLACAIAPAATGAAPAPSAEDAAVMAALDRPDVAGTVLVARGDRIVLERAFGTVDPAGGPAHRLGRV